MMSRRMVLLAASMWSASSVAPITRAAMVICCSSSSSRRVARMMLPSYRSAQCVSRHTQDATPQLAQHPQVWACRHHPLLECAT